VSQIVFSIVIYSYRNVILTTAISIKIADELFDLADMLEKKKLYRFAEQLRGAGMSPPNNIAEGSGSSSIKEFASFLNIAKPSTFELQQRAHSL
jgi:four helix bundle protein